MLDKALGRLRPENPPSHPDPRFNRASSDMEKPRTYLGIEADKAALTKLGPPPGCYFFNAETGVREQWVEDHWEEVGRGFIGEMLVLGNQPLSPRNTPGAFSYGSGGSAVAVGGPPGSGNPINSFVPGGTASGAVAQNSTTDSTGFIGTINSGMTQRVWDFTIPDPALPPAPFDQWNGIIVTNWSLTTGAGGQIRVIITIGGVIVADTTYALGTGVLGGSIAYGSGNGYNPGDQITVDVEAIGDNVSSLATVCNAYMFSNDPN